MRGDKKILASVVSDALESMGVAEHCDVSVRYDGSCSYEIIITVDNGWRDEVDDTVIDDALADCDILEEFEVEVIIEEAFSEEEIYGSLGDTEDDEEELDYNKNYKDLCESEEYVRAKRDNLQIHEYDEDPPQDSVEDDEEDEDELDFEIPVEDADDLEMPEEYTADDEDMRELENE